MKDYLQSVCDAYTEAYQSLKKDFLLESTYLRPVCANIFVNAGISPDEEQIAACRYMVKQSVGIFSNFRGNVKMPLLCTLAVDSDPQSRWERTQEYYSALKEEFFGSEFLALGASMIAEQPVLNVEELSARAKSLYKRMKKEHPFLTGSEDSVFAILLSQGTKSEDELISDMEECYRLLDERMPKCNGLQSASHVLSLMDEPPAEKCSRLFSLYDAVSERCGKYGKNFEFPVLAALSSLGKPVEETADDVAEVSAYLEGQKGYKPVFGFTRAQRLMHAGMLVSSAYTAEQRKEGGDGLQASNLAVQQAAILQVVQQQAIICACMASTAAASAASSSSH